jgi:acetyl-CoA carboxylase biotin carboxyl carrier protein
MAENRGEVMAESSQERSADAYQQLTRTVRDLVELMRQGDLDRLEVTHGDLHILLCARANNSADHSASLDRDPAASVPQPAVPDPSAARDAHFITSPMVGTFYEAPSPGEPPFVRSGDTVEVGQTVAIIEAMKIMNEIVADRPGTIEEVLVKNGETVEYGHQLFRMRLNR